MKTVILTLFTAFALAGCAVNASKPVKWEYKTVQLDPFKNGFVGRQVVDIANDIMASQRKILNENGQQGWELVDIQKNLYIFKRPIVK